MYLDEETNAAGTARDTGGAGAVFAIGLAGTAASGEVPPAAVIFFVGACLLTSGVGLYQLINEKMELSRVTPKQDRMYCVYSLRCVNDASYSVYTYGLKSPVGETDMKAGDVFRYGITSCWVEYGKDGVAQSRYDQSYLDMFGGGGVALLYFKPESPPLTYGQAYAMEHELIVDYTVMYGHLPPGNKTTH